MGIKGLPASVLQAASSIIQAAPHVLVDNEAAAQHAIAVGRLYCSFLVDRHMATAFILRCLRKGGGRIEPNGSLLRA